MKREHRRLTPDTATISFTFSILNPGPPPPPLYSYQSRPPAAAGNEQMKMVADGWAAAVPMRYGVDMARFGGKNSKYIEIDSSRASEFWREEIIEIDSSIHAEISTYGMVPPERREVR